MGAISKPQQVKLVCGFLYKDERIFEDTSRRLCRRYGKADFISGPIDFSFTDYYEKEMGKGLTRRFVSFKRAISPKDLAEIKKTTNALEDRSASKTGRRINIDPGYLTLSKLVLASTKDYCHRIYLDKGIYAEITLTFRKNSFQPWEWTYRDYRTPEYIGIFNHIRSLIPHSANKERT
jgi:hypothetical protein